MGCFGPAQQSPAEAAQCGGNATGSDTPDHFLIILSSSTSTYAVRYPQSPTECLLSGKSGTPTGGFGDPRHAWNHLSTLARSTPVLGLLRVVVRGPSQQRLVTHNFTTIVVPYGSAPRRQS